MKQCLVITSVSYYFALNYLSQSVGALGAVPERLNDEKTLSKACTIMQDGTCIDEEMDKFDVKKTVKPLPDVDEDGYIDLKYGEKQHIISQSPEQNEKTKQKLIEMHNYMHTDVYVKGPWHLRKDCFNRHESCTFWASTGECLSNPGYMKIICAPACLSCDQLLFETRCPPMSDNIDEANIWKSNDLNFMFQNISINSYYKQEYGNIDILLQPGMVPPNNDATFTDSPWVITIDDFLTPQECDMLIKLGIDRGYQISSTVGKKKFDGLYHTKISKTRTSTNTWCQDGCANHSLTQNVHLKIVNLTGIPYENSEFLQLLRYEVGQFYQQHHDYIEHDVQRYQGARIVTVFIYLNDVEEGGGTNFPLLNLTVMPKRGRILIWPSVLNENPNLKDDRTDHQALPVIKGIKYGANAWLHLRDFKTPFNQSCV